LAAGDGRHARDVVMCDANTVTVAIDGRLLAGQSCAGFAHVGAVPGFSLSRCRRARFRKSNNLRPLAAFLDSLGVTALLCSAAIIVTGGGQFDLAGTHIKALHSRPIIVALIGLAGLRFGLLSLTLPFFGWSRWHPIGLQRHFKKWLRTVVSAASLISRRREFFVLCAIGVISLVIKVYNIIASPGFYAGDDVEVHVQSLASIRGLEHDAWSLRNAFYPSVFVEPIQRMIVSMGGGSAAAVVAGRIAVALYSLVQIPLLYHLVRRVCTGWASEWGRVAGFAAVILLVLNPMETLAGSSVLPRAVVATFAMLCALLLCQHDLRSVLGAGLALGVAASIRFSEVALFAPALALLVTQRRWSHAVLVAVVGAGAAVGIWVAFDLHSGDAPGASVKAIIDYTLVEKRSTRGFEPWSWYLQSAHLWLTPVGLIWALVGVRRSWPSPIIWAVTPLIMLSVLPHKEARYVIPYLGFWCATAGIGFVVWAKSIVGGARPRSSLVLAALALLILLSGLDSQRARRSDGAVLAAQHLESIVDASSTVVVQQDWKAGGSIYLFRAGRRISIQPAPLRRGNLTELESVLKAADVDFLILQSPVADLFEGSDAALEYGLERIEGAWERVHDPHVLLRRQ